MGISTLLILKNDKYRLVSLLNLIFLLNSPSVIADCTPTLLKDSELVQRRADFLKSKTEQPLDRRLLYTSEEVDHFEIFGVPKGSEWINVSGKTFRHYSDHSNKIAESKFLFTGPAPYVIIHPGVRREIYTDLTGAFVTDVNFKPKQIGLERRAYPYVDLQFLPGTPLLKVEPGIYFVPTPQTMPGWIMKEFQDFILSGTPAQNPSHQNLILELQEKGATATPTRVPFHLVHFGR